MRQQISSLEHRASPAHDIQSRCSIDTYFSGLDCLRGEAALGVVLYHCSTRLHVPNLFWHGYLAVDFFFVLSGFVMARAYRTRLATDRLSIARFLMMRGIRLMPLIVLGTVLAAIVEIGRPGISDQHRHLIDAAEALVFGLFLVPTLHTTTLEFAVFPLNGPVWSLFFEVWANAAFAIWARSRLGFWSLAPLLGGSLVLLVWGAHHDGQIIFGPLPDHFWLGFARVTWSFSVGLILFHVRASAPGVPFLVPALVLLAVMAMPSLGAMNEAFDDLCVILILPSIVFAASSARFGILARRWCSRSGDLSYPIYALHYPLLRVFSSIEARLDLNIIGRLAMVAFATAVIVVVATAAYALFDRPIRRSLASGLGRLARGGEHPVALTPSGDAQRRYPGGLAGS